MYYKLHQNKIGANINTMKVLVIIFCVSVFGTNGFAFPATLPSPLSWGFNSQPSSTNAQVNITNPSSDYIKAIQETSQQIADSIQLRIQTLLDNIQIVFSDSPVGSLIQQSQQRIGQVFNPLQGLISGAPIPNPFSSNPIGQFIDTIFQLNNSTSGIQSFLANINGIEARNNGNSSSLNVSSIPESLRQIIQQAFQQYSNAVNLTIIQGLGTLQDSYQNLNQSTTNFLQSIDNTTRSGIKSIQDNISQFNETAQSCIRENSPGYQDIIPAARDEAQDCVNSKTNESLEIYEKGRTNIQAAIAGGQNFTSSINACQSNSTNNALQSFGCYARAILNIQSDTILLPIQLAKRFAEADELVNTLRAAGIKCVSNIGETVTEQSLNVTRAIGLCVVQ